MSNAREIAMKVIYDVEFNGAYSVSYTHLTLPTTERV